MEQHQVVKDVIDSVPPHVAEVKYDSGVEMKLGNELTPTQVKNQPVLVTWPTEPGSLYTIIFTDPDAPSRQDPTFREIKHWLVVNIPGTNISEGQTLAEYIGSGPPQGSGLHRYVLLVYKQPGKLSVADEIVTSNRSREGRISFKAREFAAKYNLGQPIAANFYQAQFDDYVPILRAQLSSGSA